MDDYIVIYVRVKRKEFNDFFNQWLRSLADGLRDLGIDDTTYEKIMRGLRRKLSRLRSDIYYALEQAIERKTIDITLNEVEKVLDEKLKPRIQPMIEQAIRKYYPSPITAYIKQAKVKQ